MSRRIRDKLIAMEILHLSHEAGRRALIQKAQLSACILWLSQQEA